MTWGRFHDGAPVAVFFISSTLPCSFDNFNILREYSDIYQFIIRKFQRLVVKESQDATITNTRVLAFTDTCSWQRSLKYRDSTTRRDQWVYLKLFENYTVTPPVNQHPPSFNCRISRPLLPFHSFFSRPKLNPIWRKWPSLSTILFISNAMSVNGQHTCVLG